MKKMIAMLLVGGVLAFCTVGCGPAATTGDGKTPVVTPKPGSSVEVKDKADVKDKASVKDNTSVTPEKK